MNLIQAILASSKSGKAVTPSVYKSQFGELPILVIKSKSCIAALSLQGAQLLFWQPTSQVSSVIWLSSRALFQKGRAIRGGIPICWPWFANLGEPAHGFARIVEWSLDSVTEDEEGIDFTLSLTNNDETDRYFTQPFTLSLSLHLGNSCQLTLSSQGDFDATSALHSYFNVDNINRVVVSGLSDDYFDKVPTVNSAKKQGELAFQQEVDRIYQNSHNPILIKDQKRIIEIINENATDVIAWNPWENKTKKMKDMDEGGYKTMVCIEMGRINQPLVLSSTQKIHYGVKIMVSTPS